MKSSGGTEGSRQCSCTRQHKCSLTYVFFGSQGIKRTTTVYNLMIRGYGKKGFLEDALHELEAMEEMGFDPNEV